VKSPKSCQDCYTISPGSLQNLAKITPKFCQNLAGVALQSCQTLVKISPQLQYDVFKTRRIAIIRSCHSCTTMSPRLAGLLYELATVALRFPENMKSCQDCNTTSTVLNTVILCIIHRVIINIDTSTLPLHHKRR
jgi:hypothetical protein